jgi:uncharacterized caspase-like protein
MRRATLLFLAAFCSAVTLFASESALAERRVALVVGNSKYRNTIQLLNPANDAQDVATRLRGLGFEVIERVDIDKRGWDLALQEFERRLPDAEAALFFFAGHGMQFRGTNYLMPVDAELTDEVSLDYEMIEIERIKRALDRAGRGVRIMVLDACRNNPLADRLARSVVGLARDLGQVRGFARVARAEGTVVAYATQANEVAQDGTGRNSPFTSAFLARLDEPGLEIGSLFRRVSGDVRQKTKGQQSPELSISLDHDFYLNTAETAAMAWTRVRDTTDPQVLRDFIARFTSSAQAPDAQYRLGVLEKTLADRAREEAERRAKAREEEELKARLAREDAERKEAERQKLAALELERIAQEKATERLAREVEEQRKRAEEAEQQRQVAIEKARAAQEAADRIVKEKEKDRFTLEAAELRKSADRAETRVAEAREKARIAQEAADRIARDKQTERLAREVEEQRQRAEAAERAKLEAQEKARLAQEAADRSKAEALRKNAELEKKIEDAKLQQLAALEQQRADREKSSAVPAGRAIEAPDLIRDAQIALKSLGCYSGAATGMMDGATTKAIQAYLAKTGRGTQDANITQDLLDELDAPGAKGMSSCVAEPIGPKPTKKVKLQAPPSFEKQEHKAVAPKPRVAEPVAAKPRVPRVVVEAPRAAPSAAPKPTHSVPSVPF